MIQWIRLLLGLSISRTMQERGVAIVVNINTIGDDKCERMRENNKHESMGSV